MVPSIIFYTGKIIMNTNSSKQAQTAQQHHCKSDAEIEQLVRQAVLKKIKEIEEERSQASN